MADIGTLSTAVKVIRTISQSGMTKLKTGDFIIQKFLLESKQALKDKVIVPAPTTRF